MSYRPLATAEPKTCASCGVSFLSHHKTQKYCSKRCMYSGAARLRAARNATKPERTCYRCGEIKPADQFPGKTHTYCRPCYNAYMRTKRTETPIEVLRERRRRSYDAEDPARRNARARFNRWRLSDVDLGDLLRKQGGGCAICLATEPGGRGTWSVDHDHACCPKGRTCGRCIRGLLCTRCNAGLGQFRDRPDLLLAAVRYLTT